MRRRLWLSLLACTACGGSPEPTANAEPSPEGSGAEVAPPVAVEGLRPLDPGQRTLIAGLPNESIPTPAEYYYRSNELRHDLLAGDLEGLGGVVLGVGPDQIYTLAALARAELIVSVDYDARIAALHRMYGVLVPRAETADELIAQFAPESEAATIARLREALPGDPQPVRTYARLRDDLHGYLQRQRARRPGDAPATWLADDGYYAYVRALFRAGRVFARTGDLTGATTVRAIGGVLHELGQTVRVVYLSNADQFFPYDEAFVANSKALPTDERTLVVRTIRHPGLPNARRDRWHYIVQEHADLLERLELGYFRRSQVVVEELIDAGPPWVGRGISHITRETPRSLLEHRRRRATRSEADGVDRDGG